MTCSINTGSTIFSFEPAIPILSTRTGDGGDSGDVGVGRDGGDGYVSRDGGAGRVGRVGRDGEVGRVGRDGGDAEVGRAGGVGGVARDGGDGGNACCLSLSLAASIISALCTFLSDVAPMRFVWEV